ncbi:MAG: 16S rRNA (guanine(966)-N(2))-methyltransferase RsmD [Chthoniobacterales bacterium]|jgi:16S rRNA (guanine966-N2)-methyltransferase|nr:16S rRNA (guanine(966)-N(2))-methyltransferase RsmD [Chthoniobacterales bacterium]
MRIIAGTAGGIRMDCPDGVARPMMDRVRGAVFSSLGEAVHGARVADLFAGSGAIGIEALSRGAASCTFVDSHRKAAQAIRDNLARTKLAGTVRQQDVTAVLTSAQDGSFDLVFADPPFALAPAEKAHPARLMDSGLLARCLAPGGIFVVELPHEPPAAGEAWELLRCRPYGQAWVAFYRKKSDT